MGRYVDPSFSLEELHTYVDKGPKIQKGTSTVWLVTYNLLKKQNLENS